MSALAHWLEQAGIRTVVIGLVRKHLEIIRPPRALWVPFELGRPIGAPGDADFQIAVLRQALELVANCHEPTLVDFASDDPRATADPQWQPPTIPSDANDTDSIASELAQLLPAQQRQLQRAGRSATGVSGLSLAECATLMDATLQADQPVDSRRSDISPLLVFRFALDDLKAAYIEAALDNGRPSSRQIHDWFWLQSQLGNSIRQLRARWMAGDNAKQADLAARFTVPHRWRI